MRMADNVPKYLTPGQEMLLAAAGGLMVANAYYIHPIIAEVAGHFKVDAATIGLVPALNQIALALGIFLMLPLGDKFSNRTLSICFAIGQTASLLLMVLSHGFGTFLFGSTVLGFFTITPYLLTAYASKRVRPERLGAVTAKLTAGTILGILIARTGAGMVAEFLDWRLVYVIATSLMVLATLALPFIMEGRPASASASDATSGRQGYLALVLSLFPLLRQHPQVLVSGAIQALNFGIFLSVWLGLALHLTSPEMGYGVHVVGYLAGFAAIAIYATPRIGAWADKAGAEKARLTLSIAQLAGVILLYPFGESLWLLIIPLIIMNTVGPGIDVSGRMTFLSLAPAIRTRLMTGYIVIMFIGAGIASWAGTAAYGWAGWAGNSVIALVLSATLVGLSAYALRKKRELAAA